MADIRDFEFAYLISLFATLIDIMCLTNMLILYVLIFFIGIISIYN